MTFRFPMKNPQGGASTMEGSSRPPAPARVSVFRRWLVRVTPAERLAADGGGNKDIIRPDNKDEIRPPAGAMAGGGSGEAEVGSVALDRMVLSFMEDAAAVERPARGRCNCFNGGSGNQDASDDEDFDFLPSSSSSSAAAAAPAAAGDALELLKGLVQCASTAEQNLLADASRIAERCGNNKGGGGRKKAEVRRAVASGLRALGYDAAVCHSRWEKGPSHPAGEHEYIDAVVEVDCGSGATATPTTTTTRVRLVVEVDFRSEFEVARPTKAYRAALQALPPLFVGTPDRAGRIVAVVAEAARQSLRKRGLHFPPWRKPEYMRAKWLAPHARCCHNDDDDDNNKPTPPSLRPTPVSAGEFQLRFDDKATNKGPRNNAAEDVEVEDEEEKITLVVAPSPWRAVAEPGASNKQSPQPQASEGRVVTGLASVL